MARHVLYSMPISHWCVSADRMLAFKGVAFDTKYVPYHDKRELIAATGQDYVPTLVWDGKPVMWHDIPDFLEKERPTPTLYPDGQRGLAVVLEQWAHAVVEEKVWRYVVTKVPPVLRDDRERWVFEEMQVRARGPCPRSSRSGRGFRRRSRHWRRGPSGFAPSAERYLEGAVHRLHVRLEEPREPRPRDAGRPRPRPPEVHLQFHRDPRAAGDGLQADDIPRHTA